MTEPVAPRPGRNEPCHCGSGKKYKQCCLDKDEAAERQARTEATTTAKPVEPAEPVAGTVAEPHRVQPPPKHSTRQPWKQRTQDTRSFQKVNVPRRSGGS